MGRPKLGALLDVVINMIFGRKLVYLAVYGGHWSGFSCYDNCRNRISLYKSGETQCTPDAWYYVLINSTFQLSSVLALVL